MAAAEAGVVTCTHNQHVHKPVIIVAVRYASGGPRDVLGVLTVPLKLSSFISVTVKTQRMLVLNYHM